MLEGGWAAWSPILPISVLSLARGEVGVTNRGGECKGRGENEAGDRGDTLVAVICF